MERNKAVKVISSMVIMGEFASAACGGSVSKPISPLESAIATSQARIDCTHLKPSIDACATQRDYDFFKSNIEMAERMVSSSTVSSDAKQKFVHLFTNIKKLQSEGRIQWYEYNDTKYAYGIGEQGKRGIVWPWDKVGNYMVNLVLPNRIFQGKAEGLELDGHEMLHITNGYNRFLSGGEAFVAAVPDTEEYEAGYYGALMGAIAEGNGFVRADNNKWKDFGIDDYKVVYYLDQAGMGPLSGIYQYLSDTSTRFLYQDRVNQLQKYTDDPHNKQLVEDAKAEIQKVDDKWKSYPPKGSKDFDVIKKMIQSEWTVPGFFPHEEDFRKGTLSPQKLKSRDRKFARRADIFSPAAQYTHL
ncbi:hypothetical protein A3D77_00475 [Candidatus Gottesmanbacteria bacterium RIFCSPHIGHO2_02_FULL_39_11]|uniref:Uncharacterized protein n=1 Tax=Candidatus Gottesmanbacteria bacterium RIFCSPHIGHO2_02_FULL_39_11 TaxID=1798382 RepID=A0A1F5ZLC9_9BACT|nr:MAG: hypothetical protein A3D77_00475 [Candidatus Gottesmanbacteria bacterium RIFCSPHIGHO2_02_FULL_39_11]